MSTYDEFLTPSLKIPQPSRIRIVSERMTPPRCGYLWSAELGGTHECAREPGHKGRCRCGCGDRGSFRVAITDWFSSLLLGKSRR